MGSDLGPHVLIRASFQSLLKDADLHLILVGKQADIQHISTEFPQIPSTKYRIVHTDEFITMDERPTSALKKKLNSSMSIALSLVAAGEVEGCVSAGNTGALMVLSKYWLKMYPGIDRPAISTVLPGEKGFTRVLDLGANVDCDSETLFNFAVMGSVMSQAIDGIDKPKVGLLNIGVEDIKGNDKVKQAARLLDNSDLINYCGFVEGDQIYRGNIDVIVCDGFVGNAVLKASEGITHYFGLLIKEKLLSGFRGLLLHWLLKPSLKKLRDEINPDRYNGACLSGLNKVVIKSHGGADIVAMQFAIKEATQQVRLDVPNRVWKALDKLESMT